MGVDIQREGAGWGAWVRMLARSSRHRAQDAITGGSVGLADRGSMMYGSVVPYMYTYMLGVVAIHDVAGVSICR